MEETQGCFLYTNRTVAVWMNAAVGDIGIIFYRLDVGFRDKLQPNDLPNTCSAGIVTATGIICSCLFPGGNKTIACIILSEDGNLVFTFSQGFRYIKSEGHISAFVFAYKSSVNICSAVIVHGAKVEKRFAIHLSQYNCTLVPNTVYKIGISDPGKLAFGAEGYIDDIAQSNALIVEPTNFTAAALVNLKLPLPVEIKPILTYKLRTGVFRSWNCHIYSSFFSSTFVSIEQVE